MANSDMRIKTEISDMKDSIKKRFNLLYNGKVIPPEENLDKTINDGDEILFFQLAGA